MWMLWHDDLHWTSSIKFHRGASGMNKLLIMGLASSVLGLGLLTTVNAADPKPEDVVKYRQSVYTVIGWNLKGL